MGTGVASSGVLDETVPSAIGARKFTNIESGNASSLLWRYMNEDFAEPTAVICILRMNQALWTAICGENEQSIILGENQDSDLPISRTVKPVVHSQCSSIAGLRYSMIYTFGQFCSLVFILGKLTLSLPLCSRDANFCFVQSNNISRNSYTSTNAKIQNTHYFRMRFFIAISILTYWQVLSSHLLILKRNRAIRKLVITSQHQLSATSQSEGDLFAK